MFISSCQCLESGDVLLPEQWMLTQKGNKRKAEGNWQGEEKAQLPSPAFTALSHSQAALLATSQETSKGRHVR